MVDRSMDRRSGVEFRPNQSAKDTLVSKAALFNYIVRACVHTNGGERVCAESLFRHVDRGC